MKSEQRLRTLASPQGERASRDSELQPHGNTARGRARDASQPGHGHDRAKHVRREVSVAPRGVNARLEDCTRTEALIARANMDDSGPRR